MQKAHMRILNLKMLNLMTLSSISDFGGLWKHHTNSVCTKSVRVFIILKKDTEEVKKECHDIMIYDMWFLLLLLFRLFFVVVFAFVGLFCFCVVGDGWGGGGGGGESERTRNWRREENGVKKLN